MKKFAKNLWELCYPMLIYTMVGVIISIGFAVVIMALMMITNPNATETELYNEILMYSMPMTFIAAAITTPFFVLFKRRDDMKAKMAGTFKKYEKVDWYKYIWIIPFAIFTMYAANIFVSILALFMPEFMTKSYMETEEAIYGSSLIMQILAGGIMGPIVEEYLFRGLVYNRALRFAKPTMAGVISAALFGIYHGNWIQAPYAFLLGLALAFVYDKYKNMAAPIILHVTANMIAVIITAVTKNMAIDEVNMPAVQEALTYVPMFVITGVLAFVFGKVIDNSIEAKEIDNEVIDSSNTML